MKLLRFLSFSSLAAAALSTAACSISATDLAPEATNEDDGSPVKTQALAGKIRGAAFTAKTALKRGDSVSIYAAEGSCEKTPETGDGDKSILLSVKDWRDGAAYQLDFFGGKSVTFVEHPSSNYVIAQGRVEVVTAGTEEAPGKLRLRVGDDDNGSVEGEIAVQNCAGY